MARVVTLTAEHNDKSVFGFAIWVFAWSCFLVYLIWTTVDDEILSKHGMDWLPSKYWALALPGCLVIFLCSYTVIYALIGMSVNPMPTSMDSLRDGFSNITQKHLDTLSLLDRSFLRACLANDQSRLTHIDVPLHEKQPTQQNNQQPNCSDVHSLPGSCHTSPHEAISTGTSKASVSRAGASSRLRYLLSSDSSSGHEDGSSSLVSSEDAEVVDNFQLPTAGDVPWSLANQLIHLHPNLSPKQRKKLFQGQIES